nr:F-box protein CPR1-like [Coffea arabica]
MASRLPLALIEEIFSRLPIKTLIRFRCLSKSWRATIGSQEFIKNYLKNSSHHNLILGNFNGSSDLVVDEVYFYSADYDFFLETDRAVFNELSLPVRSRIDLETDILGSCNGLLCVLSLWDDRPILWNPSTREHPILLCALEFRCPFTGGTWYTNYGFGDDSVGDDYKVVAIPVIYGKDDQVYSEVMVHEEFKLLQQPEYFDRHCDMRLGILEGCLSLICEYYKSHFDIWVMAEYGVQKSWTNLVLIKICDLSTNCRLSTSYPQAVKPIAYSKCSRRVLLGQANQLLLWYDIESISITYPVMQVTGAEQFFELGMFLQSLVKAQQ